MIDPKTKYLVIGAEVATNMKTEKDELTLTLYDLYAQSAEGAVTTLTTPDYVFARRDAQWYETDRVEKFVQTEFPITKNKS